MTEVHLFTQIFENAGHKVRVEADSDGYSLYVGDIHDILVQFVFDKTGKFSYFVR